jgi:hypothetical protein
VGTSVSDTFVSCIRSTSGWARSSHYVTFSRRAFNELTFRVAMRMAFRLHDFDRLRAWCSRTMRFRCRSDLILSEQTSLSEYTAREAGKLLRKEANVAVSIPPQGGLVRMFSAKHEFGPYRRN